MRVLLYHYSQLRLLVLLKFGPLRHSRALITTDSQQLNLPTELSWPLLLSAVPRCCAAVLLCCCVLCHCRDGSYRRMQYNKRKRSSICMPQHFRFA